MNQTRRRKKWILWTVKILIVAVVFWWVRNTLVKAAGQLADYDWHVEPAWLLAAGVLYLVGLLPAGLFWHRVLRALGQDAYLLETLRAYYIGHLGKYVPGKAMVVILRAGLVRSHRVDAVAAGVSVFYETLSMMAVGAFWAAAVLAVSFRQERVLLVGSLAMMGASGLPILPPVFRRLVRFLGIGKSNGSTPSQLQDLGFGLMLLGGGLMTATWCMLGLSLWATFRAIGIEGFDPVGYFASYICSVALATVAGILSMIPGGFGVRDVVLAESIVQLFRSLTPGQATVASGMLRLVWLVSELVISGILYFVGGRVSPEPKQGLGIRDWNWLVLLSGGLASRFLGRYENRVLNPDCGAAKPQAALPNPTPPTPNLQLSKSPNPPMLLSVVIPVFNEEASLETLHKELDQIATAQGYQLDVVFVDDGSTDGSWELIRRLAAADPRVRGIRFRRNFGKAAALSAGFAEARGELVMTLDADLQDDPAEIPRFLAEIDKGFDVVSGWKKVRHDPWHKVFPSRIFNAMVSRMTGVVLHDHNCGMKCYRREIFDEVVLYGELHRFVPVLAAARGFRVGELVINHRARKFGYSKYGVSRFVKGFLDLLTVKFLTGFGQRPQHILGTIGLLSFLLGGLGLAYLAVYWLVAQTAPDLGLLPLHQRPAVIYSMGLLLLGAQLMSIGFLAELIIAYHRHDARIYSISARTGPPNKNDSPPPPTPDSRLLSP